VKVVVQGTVVPASGPGASNTGSPGPGPVGASNVSFTASSLSLEPSQITGTVASVNAGSLSFGLATLPIFFVPPSATAGGAPNYATPLIITVQTTAATTYTNVSGISGLNVNDYVSVGGWVFSTPNAATKVTVAAQAVVERGATPLF